MANRFFSSEPLFFNNGMAILRIVTGALMAYHGWEIFQASKMQEYASWEVIKSLPSPFTMVYAGKAVELITGICLVLGLFTRLSALLMAANMLFICFFVGNGKFYYEDQHPFIFAMLAAVFFFTGPGSFALDKRLFHPTTKMQS